MKKIANADLGRLSPEQYGHSAKLPVAVVLDNVRSMNNVGAVFRTADAFAVERLVLCGITGTPPDREIHKTALGAEQVVPWSHFPTTNEALDGLIGEGYTPVAVEQVEGAVALGGFVPADGEKYALVFGNEVDGVAQGVVDRCAAAIEIPQCGTKHSLNVAVSAGVVLWHFFAAARETGTL